VATIGKVVDEFGLSDGRRVASAKTESMPAYVGAGEDSTAVYSDQKGVVYSIKTNGTKNWKFRAGGRIVFVKPVNENVLLGSADNFVYFMSVEYGNLLWKRRLPGRIANGELIGNNLAIFTVVGENSAYVIELEKGRLVDQISLADEDAFLLTPIGANGAHLFAATRKGISAFSSDCSNEKSGK
jgi:outer membrane protein assembly factor BamB